MGAEKNERVSSRERLYSVISSSEPCATGKNLKKINKKQNKRETSRSFSQSKKKTKQKNKERRVEALQVPAISAYRRLR